MNILYLLKQKMLKNRRRIVIILIVVFTLLTVRAGSDVWMGQQLKNESSRLEKQYGPLAWDPVRKHDAWRTWPRRIAPINRARLLDAAAARVTLSDANADLIYSPSLHSMITADQARAIADENRDALQLAIQAARLQHSNWEILNIAEPANVPNLMDLVNLSKILAIAARSDTDAGRADEAIAKVTAGFAEASAMRREPVPIMALNAINVVGLQVEVLKNILHRADPSGPALATLAAMIDENLAGAPMREAMLGELKHGLHIWPWVEHGYFNGRQPGETTTAWKRGVAWLCRPVIRFMAMRDLTAKASAVEASSIPRSQRSRASWQHSVGGRSIPSSFGLIEAGDSSSSFIGLAASAVALRRYKLDHGAYPDTLDALVPSYLKAVMLDPYTDRRPKYKRQGAGFELLLLRSKGVTIVRGVRNDKVAVKPFWEWNIPR
jgi:hypothetical protein